MNPPLGRDPLPASPSIHVYAVPVTPELSDGAPGAVQALVCAVEALENVAVPLPAAPAGEGPPVGMGEKAAAQRIQRVARGWLGRLHAAYKRRVKANNEKARRMMAEQHRRVAEMVSGWNRSASSGASSSNPKKKSCHLKKCKHCGTGTGARAKICANEACKKPFESVSKWAKYKRKARSKKKDWDSATKKQKAEFALKQLDKCFVCQDPVNYNATTTICTDCNTKMCVHCAEDFANSMVRSAFPIYLENPNYVPDCFGLWKKPCSCQKWCKFPVINPAVKDDGTKPSLDADDKERMKMRCKTIAEKPSLWDEYFNKSVSDRQFVIQRNILWKECQDKGLIEQFPSGMQLHLQFQLARATMPRKFNNLVEYLSHMLETHSSTSGYDSLPSLPTETLYKIKLENTRSRNAADLGMSVQVLGGTLICSNVRENSVAAQSGITKDMIIKSMRVVKYHSTIDNGLYELGSYKADSNASETDIVEGYTKFIQEAVHNREATDLHIFMEKIHVVV